jgi:hypothetical protein
VAVVKSTRNVVSPTENMAKQRPNYDQAFLLLNDFELRTMYYELREELSNPALVCVQLDT